jgi:hypothetical protein
MNRIESTEVSNSYCVVLYCVVLCCVVLCCVVLCFLLCLSSSCVLCTPCCQLLFLKRELIWNEWFIFIFKAHSNNHHTFHRVYECFLHKNTSLHMYRLYLRRVWRYQRGNQNLYIEEEQTTQWSREKVQKDKQRLTKYTYKTKDLVTRTPLKLGMNLGAPEG